MGEITLHGIESRVSRLFRENRILLFLILFVIGTSQFLRLSVNFYSNPSLAQTIPIALSYDNSNLFLSDPMVQTKMFYHTVYYKGLAAFNQLTFSDLFQSIFFLHFIFIVSIVFITYGLCLVLTNNITASIISSIFVFGHVIELRGFPIGYHGELKSHSHNVLHFVLVLISLFSLAKGKRVLFFICLAGAFYIHSLQTLLFVFCYAFSDFLWCLRIKKRPNIMLYILFILLCAPLVVRQIMSQNAGVLPAGWFNLFVQVNGLDSIPASWDFIVYYGFATTVLIFAYFLQHIDHSEIRTKLKYFFYAVLFLCCLQVIGTYFFQSYLVSVLQLTRATRYISLFLFIMSGYIFYIKIQSSRLYFLPATLFALATMSFDSSIVDLTVWSFFFSSLSIISFLLVDLYLQKITLQRFLGWALLCLLPLLCFAFDFALGLFQFNFLFKIRFQPLLFIYIASILLVTIIFLKFHLKIKTQVFLFVLVVAVSFQTSQQMYKNRLFGLERNWYLIQNWAKENSTSDEVFLTPPWLFGFRIFSERSTFLEWRDGTQQNFSKSFAQVFIERAKLISINPDSPKWEGYLNLSVSLLHQLKQKYNVRYYVTSSENVSEASQVLPTVYQNYRYKILLIQ